MKHFLYSLFLASFLASCGLSSRIDPSKITSINIIDRNGMTETINSKERLSAFENTNFFSPQPYQKVMRVYGRQKNGDIRSCITSYHPNGQIKQYLEASNNRAFGKYQEWFPNGNCKVDAYVIGGIADLNTQAEQSWLFDGINRAWDDEGHLVAEIRYAKGDLEGESLYFHPNGKIWKTTPYHQNQPHGLAKIFLPDGTLLQTTTYHEGEKEGPSLKYWDSTHLAAQEEYKKGCLLQGVYKDCYGKTLAQIVNGNGTRAIFGKNTLQELQEYRNGVQEGSVKIYDENHHLLASYSIKNGEKQGEEINYYPSSAQPKLLLTWHQGVLQGPVKTWYENGQIESQKEMSGNLKNGFLSAWYPNGALMLVEEYDSDKLLKGEYFRMGEKIPVSQIEKGKGIATLFNPEGNFSHKIRYQDGKPAE